ncbi:hypothetical protein DFH06DRAFT_1417321 [Mycena polygramma]|nr:hypothetical protein DFH06DRAFT_1417321 [Mycena polygramma]
MPAVGFGARFATAWRGVTTLDYELPLQWRFAQSCFAWALRLTIRREADGAIAGAPRVEPVFRPRVFAQPGVCVILSQVEFVDNGWRGKISESIQRTNALNGRIVSADNDGSACGTAKCGEAYRAITIGWTSGAHWRVDKGRDLTRLGPRVWLECFFSDEEAAISSVLSMGEQVGRLFKFVLGLLRSWLQKKSSLAVRALGPPDEDRVRELLSTSSKFIERSLAEIGSWIGDDGRRKEKKDEAVLLLVLIDRGDASPTSRDRSTLSRFRHARPCQSARHRPHKRQHDPLQVVALGDFVAKQLSFEGDLLRRRTPSLTDLLPGSRSRVAAS